MDQNQEQDQKRLGQDQARPVPAVQKIPTPADLYQGWREGGAKKLEEMLPDVPEGEE